MQLPYKLKPLFTACRVKTIYGGRGSAKSWSVARIMITKAMTDKLRIMCAREYQNSIRDSVHKLLRDQIEELGFTWSNKPNDGDFQVTDVNIRCNLTGSEFFFIGLKNNVSKIKSTEGVDLCWIEEAETVSEESWQTLLPTIRKPGSEIWITFNPREETDPTYQRFVINAPKNSICIEMNWKDNPFFFDTELNEERLNDLDRLDTDTYENIWEGKTISRSQAQVLYDKVLLQEVKPLKSWNGPYYGLDWGFASDPLRMVRCWVHDGNLYIEKEANGYHIDINEVVAHLKKYDPHCHKYAIRADNALPQNISYCKQHGLPKIVPCKKGPGSVNNGITFLRSFKNIIIDPSCTHTIEEARLYKYKTDKLTGDVLPDIIDAFNHSWDAVRYAMEPLLPTRRKKAGVKVVSGSRNRNPSLPR